MGLEILRATIDDLEALLPLVTAYRVFYRRDPDPQREREFTSQNLRENRSAVFLARNDGVAIGFVQIFQTHSTVWLGPSLILEDLFVAPEARGAGAATKLIERAEAYAREIGAVGMFLETAMDNTAAQRVYERAGWTREDRFYKYNAQL
ncbi:MAG TPA: GNAT family N-acetyltransferase [Candidatus Baltobacteraceae bacterium]|jgi:ribosomal protein S18 acetylase RimI-like enzyme|nr:GNAT family N-acetyltransferase [Candidatus Baltobacteraceae bacterium]